MTQPEPMRKTASNNSQTGVLKEMNMVLNVHRYHKAYLGRRVRKFQR